jgi:hypothetical protein
LFFFFLIVVLQRDPIPDDYDSQAPEQKTIYRFMRVLFTAAQLTAECAIVTLVNDIFFLINF